MADAEHVVIIGAGQAGLSAAAELRKRKFDGAITLIGAEDAPPYQRPPLSKAYLAGDLPRERLWLKADAFYDKAEIALKTGVRAEAIDRSASAVVLEDGARIGFDHLILATGGRAATPPIPGAALPGVFVLRTLDDADALGAAMREAKRLAILGAGYIGLEVAASARKRGLDVAIAEAAERPMARTASPVLSAWVGGLHRGRGVDLRVNAPVERIAGADKAEGLVLADGETLEADLVVLATGLVPETGLAEAAGLEVDGGIIVDHHARTSDPRIYAAGDAALTPLERYARSMRLESVQNAIDEGKAAARAILGDETPYDPVPWFWSDQYEVKIQIAGLYEGADATVRRGDPEEGRFALFHFRGDALIACEAVNAAPEYMAAQRLIERGAPVDRDTLRDPGVAMRDFLS